MGREEEEEGKRQGCGRSERKRGGGEKLIIWHQGRRIREDMLAKHHQGEGGSREWGGGGSRVAQRAWHCG